MDMAEQKEYLVKLTEKEVGLIRYGLRCAIKEEYRNADIIVTASQLKGESTLDCAEDALVQEFFESTEELRKLDHRFEGECTADGQRIKSSPYSERISTC